MPISNATSNELPGITFVFSGTGFSIEPPVSLNLYLDQNLEKLAVARKEMPNYFPGVRVHGIETDAGMFMDSADAYQMMLKEKEPLTLFARLSLTLAILTGACIAWRIRLIFQ